MTAGQISDYSSAAAFLRSLPVADWLLADPSNDADWFREALKDNGIKTCLPARTSLDKLINYDRLRDKRRNSIDIMSGRLAPHGNSLRQMPEEIPIRRRSRRYRHVWP